MSVGRIGWSHGHPRRLGSTARALLARRRSHTLLADRYAPATKLAVLFDGSAAAAHALALAARLAPPMAGGLVVLPTGPKERRQAAQQLGERAAAARFEKPADGKATAVAAVVRSCRAGLLILPVEEADADGSELPDLLAAVRCPVLAVS